MNTKKIILASNSPRRRELLEDAGYAFTVDPSSFDESTVDWQSMPPHELAQFLSMKKAEDVAHRHPGCVILAADTFIVLDGEILGKPHTPEEARRMLDALNNRAHSVITGFTVMRDGQSESRSVESRVVFRQLTGDAITEYIATGEPLDKAGAYAIQGGAAGFVHHLEGPHDNVIGLPMTEVRATLKSFL